MARRSIKLPRSQIRRWKLCRKKCEIPSSSHLFACIISQVFLVHLNQLQCRAIVCRISRYSRRAAVECRRIAWISLVDRVVVWRWKNLRFRCRTFVNGEGRIYRAVVQNCASRPHWLIWVWLWWFLFGAGYRAIAETMECEISVGQKGHRCDAWDL